MKLVIDRKTWFRGNGESKSRLLLEEGTQMCCLGFFARQCLGAKKKDIRGVSNPGNKPSLPWPKWLVNQGKTPSEMDTNTCFSLMNLNDDTEISEKRRERKIAKIFADHDVEVTFR